MAKRHKAKDRKRKVTAIDYSEAVDAFVEKLVEVRANIEGIVDDDWARPSLRQIDSFLTLKQAYDRNDLPDPVMDAIWATMWCLVAEHGRGWWA